MIKVSVMYPHSPGVRFDHDYYRDKHLPLIKSRMGAALKYYTIDKELSERRRTSRRRTSPCVTCFAIPSRRTSPRMARMLRRSEETSATSPIRPRSNRSVRWWSRTRPRAERSADVAMTGVSVDSLVALGFVLGLRHAVEADHLAAISTIATERRSLLSSLLVGASWGCGHTLALLIAGVGVLLLRYRMTDRMAHAFELCVGVMLVLLGANVLRTLVHRSASQSHDNTTAVSHSHSDAWLVARPLLVGTVPGFPAARHCCSSL